jgi:very-short-patch-repair endonuclease
MSRLDPSSGAARHLLPQGEKEENRRKPAAQGEKVGDETQPSPLAGEGVSRRLTGEGSHPAHHALVPKEKRQFARRLRKEMTEAEKKLWQELCARRFEKFKFRRQFPVGPYIADFVCLSNRLIVEVDGSQHDASEHDRKRDVFLNEQGFRVLRLWNIGVLKDMDGAILTILDALENTPHPPRAPRPAPSPLAGEGRSRTT